MIRLLVLLCALCCAALTPAWAPAWAQSGAKFDRSSLSIDSGGRTHQFSIELALSAEQQTQGLMWRKTMPADHGMLFVYDRDQEITMWMRNTLIPLDMVFMRADGQITHIRERAVPQSLEVIASNGPARAVLELNGGTVRRLGLKVGDRVVHPRLGGS